MGKAKNFKRSKVVILVFVIYMLTNFHRPAVTVIGEQLIEDFGLTSVNFGFIGLVFMIAYALMQFPVGIFNDTWGPRKVILISLIITSFGAVLFGMSRSYPVLIASRILVAAGISGFSASGAKLLAEWFRKKQFSRLWGLFMGWGVMGSVLATRPLVMLASSVGWRISFISTGMLSVVILLLAYLVIESPPEIEKSKGQKEKTQTKVCLKEVNKSGWDNLIAALSRYETWLVILYFIGINSSGQVLCSLWGGVFLKTVYGFNDSIVANILMVSAICMIFGSILSGFVKPQIGMILGSFAFAVAWLVATLGMESLNIFTVYTVFALIGFIQFWAVVAGFVYLRVVTPTNIYGTVYGIVNGAGWILGTGAFQQVWGFILQNGDNQIRSFQMAMVLQLVVLVLSCLAAVALAIRRERMPQAMSV
jgi:sugar phosphate permease